MNLEGGIISKVGWTTTDRVAGRGFPILGFSRDRPALDQGKNLFHIRKSSARLLVIRGKLERFAKARTRLDVTLLGPEHQAQIQVGLVNATLMTTGRFPMNGLSFLQSPHNGEQSAKEDVPSGISRSGGNRFPIPGLSAAKLAFLAIEVAKMRLNEVKFVRWTEAQGTPHGGKGFLVESHGIKRDAECEPRTTAVGKISREPTREFPVARSQATPVSAPDFLETLLEILAFH